MRLDFYAFVCWGEAQAACDAIFEKFDVGVIEFDDFLTIDADEVIVVGAFDEVGVVDSFFASEVNFFEEPAFHEERERAIDSCPGDGRVDST